VVAPLVDDEDDDLFNAALDAIEAREREKNLKRELDLVREQLRLAHERELFIARNASVGTTEAKEQSAKTASTTESKKERRRSKSSKSQ